MVIKYKDYIIVWYEFLWNSYEILWYGLYDFHRLFPYPEYHQYGGGLCQHVLEQYQLFPIWSDFPTNNRQWTDLQVTSYCSRGPQCDKK